VSEYLLDPQNWSKASFVLWFVGRVFVFHTFFHAIVKVPTAAARKASLHLSDHPYRLALAVLAGVVTVLALHFLMLTLAKFDPLDPVAFAAGTMDQFSLGLYPMMGWLPVIVGLVLFAPDILTLRKRQIE
jgi:hypothetical protein